jgi:predicted dehydrogenase
MTEKLGIGILGCGNISAAYFKQSALFRGIEIRACADINIEAARVRAKEFGVRADTVEDMLAADDIDLVINLTVPAVHYETSAAVLRAGKHVYSEKPFVLSMKEGQEIAKIAAEKGLRVGSAPDTFLGSAHQLARKLVDSGDVGEIVSGSANMMSFGMEHWHPNPDFFFQPGAGPVLDVGPYYIANMVQLIGPIKRVSAISATPRTERLISSEPRAGEYLKVDTPTTLHSLIEFHSGAVIPMTASWDVQYHEHNNMEFYGETGTLILEDPNAFSGEVRMTEMAEKKDIPFEWDHPFQGGNGLEGNNPNYRGVGLADMVGAIIENRPHRCSFEFALHTVDVMLSILKAAETGVSVVLETTCERPAALPPEAARALMA